MENFSKALISARKSKGYNQITLAKELNKSSGAIGNWESGKNYPTISELLKLCKLLEVTPNYLLLGEDDRLEIEVNGKKYTSTDILKMEGKLELLNEIIKKELGER